MNVMQVVGLVTKFMSNPEAAVSDLEQSMIIPGWFELEKSVGGKVNIVLMQEGNQIKVHVYRVAENQRLDFVETYTLAQLMHILKQKAQPDNGKSISQPIATTNIITIDSPADAGSATTEPTEPATSATDDRESDN